jgi:UV DNA damage endonuclease
MNLGYACINITLGEKGITTNRGMIKRTFQEKGIQYASQLALSNVQGLLEILKWNVENGIKVFRITSELFPWASEYKLEDMPDYREIRSVLEEAGKLPVRVSTHPGPFNKLAGSGATLENTIKDLEIHSQIFDLMQLEPSHWTKINIHVGGAYGDKIETIKRFAQNFKLLSSNLQKRLTVENDDKPGLYTVKDLMPLHEMIGTPIVLDYFHHRLHPDSMTEEEAFHLAYSTWDVRPTFHYSSSRREKEDPTAKREAHSDWAHEKINTYGKDLDIMLETKMKELSVLKYWEECENKKAPQLQGL